MEQISSRDIFNFWKNKVNEDGPTKYLKANRHFYIQMLVDYFKKSNIELSEVKSYKTDVVRFLTTQEGRKGKGKYLNWPESIRNDFDQEIAAFCVNIEKQKPIKSDNFEQKESKYIIPNSKLIEQWAKEKYYSNQWVVNQAHNITSSFHDEFVQDVFGKYMI